MRKSRGWGNIDKVELRAQTLSDLKDALSIDIKVARSKGELDGPFDFEAKWETLRAPIFDNMLLAGSFTFLEIDETEVKDMLRQAYIDCGVEVSKPFEDCPDDCENFGHCANTEGCMERLQGS